MTNAQFLIAFFAIAIPLSVLWAVLLPDPFSRHGDLNHSDEVGEPS